MNEERSAQSWWTTLPGVLTATATTITAIGGLIAIISQTGLLHPSTPATPPIVASASSSASPSANTTATKDAAPATAAQAETVAATQSVPATPALAPSSAPSKGGTIGSNMAFFVGNWKNVNPQTDGIVELQIRIAESNLYVRAWGKCRPTNCDLGEVQAEGYGSNVGSQRGVGARVVTAQFKTNVRQIGLTIHPTPNGRIRVEAASNFTDQSGRAPLAREFLFERM